MTRTLKQILYGGAYTAIIFAIVISIYNKELKPIPSCFDGKQNQEETSIDCGGPNCIACDTLRLKSLEARGNVRVFQTSFGQAVLLGEVENPNITHGARGFEYHFVVYDFSGAVIETIRGRSSVSPSGSHYIFAPIVKTKFSSIERVDLVFSQASSMAWFRAGEALTPGTITARITSYSTTSDTVRINGILNNQSSIGSTNVTIIAILVDEEGNEVFASQTVVPTLFGHSDEEFIIFFPTDATIVEHAYLEETKLFVTAQ